MSRLFPRLLPSAALERFNEFNRLPIDELGRRTATADDSAVFVATGGTRVTPLELEEHRARIVDLAKAAGFPHDSSASLKVDFDRALAEYLHRELGIVPAEAASGDVWAFFALVLLPDVAFWRFPGPVKDRFLATDMTRHSFGRLWWRAHLIHRPGDPLPYEGLTLVTGEEFGQIYERRSALGASPALITGILRAWNHYDIDAERRLVFRDFLMRLLRLRAFVSFEALSHESLERSLRRVLEESISAHDPEFAARRAASPRPVSGRDAAKNKLATAALVGPVNITRAISISGLIERDVTMLLDELVEEGRLRPILGGDVPTWGR